MSNESFEQLVNKTLGKYSNIAPVQGVRDTSLSAPEGQMSYDEYKKALIKKFDESLNEVVEPHLSPHRTIDFPKQPEPEKPTKKQPEYKSPIRVRIPEGTLAHKNYNPGNIRYAGQPGARPGVGGFARFETPEAGYDHIKRQIAIDRDRGLNLSQFITKYAPPTENDTNLYIQQATSELGILPDEPLSQIDEERLAQFIAKKESGSKIEEFTEESKTPLKVKESIEREPVESVTTMSQGIIRSLSLPVKDMPEKQEIVEVSPYDDLLSNAITATKNLLKKGIPEGDKATYTGQGIKRTRADFSDIKEDAKNVYEWLTKKRGESGIDVNIPDETRVNIEYTGQKAPVIEGLEPETMKIQNEPFNIKEYMEAQAGSKGEAEITKQEGPSAPFLVPPPEKFVESGNLKPGPPETIPELKELNEADRRSTLANAKIAAERGVEYADLMTDWYLASVGLAKEKPLYDREEKLYQKMINDPIKGETYLEESLYGAAGMAPAMLKGSAQGMALAGMTALATGGWGAPLVGGAYMAGAAQYWYRMGTGSIYSSMRKEGINPNIASPLAQVMGVPYAIIEFMQSKKIAYDPTGIHNKVVLPTIRRVATRALKEYGVDIMSETGEEIGQEIVEMATVEMGKAIQNYLSDAGIEHTSLGEVVSRLVGTTVQSAGALAIMMGPKKAMNTIGEIASVEDQKSIVRDGVKQFRKGEDILRKERNKLLTIPASERAESQAIQDNLKKYEEGIADLKVAREKYTKAAKEQLEKGIVRLGNIGVSGDKITIDGKKIKRSYINNIIGLPQYAEVEFEDGSKKTYLDPKDVNQLLEESEKKWVEAQNKRKPRFRNVKKPPVEGTYLNIGLKVGDEVTLETKEIIKALEQEFGVKVLESSEHESETEPTATIKIDRDLTEEEVNKINLMFDQEAVAVLSSDGKGAMIGPKSERWGEFDEEKFILPDGNTIAQERETLKEKPQKPTVAPEKPVSEKTPEKGAEVPAEEERAPEKKKETPTLETRKLPWIGDKEAEFKYDGTEIQVTRKDDPLNVEDLVVQRVKNNGERLEVYKPGEPGETFDIDTQYWDIEVKKLKINEEEVTKEIPQKESNLKNLSDQAIINSYIDYTIEEELREMYDEEPTENPVLTEIANRIELKQDGSFNSKKAKELFGLLKGNKRLVGPVEYSEFINEIKQHYNEFVAISGKAGKIKAPEAKEAPEKKETNRVVDKNPELKWIEEKLPNKKPEKKENISEYEGEEISPQKISRKLTPKTAEKALSKVVDEHAKEKGIYGIYYDAEENKKVATNTGYLVVIPEKISGESRVVKPSTGDEIGKSFPDYKRVIEEFKPGIIAEDVDVDDLRATVEGIVRLNDFVVNGKYPIFAKVRIGGVEHYYNPKYLKNAVDALLSTGSKNIEFSFSGTEKDKHNPLIIRDKDNVNKLAVIMPVVQSATFEETIDKYAVAIDAKAQGKVQRQAKTPPQEELPKKEQEKVPPVESKNYNDAIKQSSKNKKQNIILSDNPGASKKDKVVLVQISNRAARVQDAGEDYYNALYSGVRSGYVRPGESKGALPDFWEVPPWLAVVRNSVKDSDIMVARDIKAAAQQINDFGYKHVAFSVMDVNKSEIKEIIKNLDSDIKVSVGGYIENPKEFFSGYENVTYYPEIEEFVKALGKEYKPGYDYSLFKGTKTIARLCLSRGCKHHCAFCDVSPHGRVSALPQEEIDRQIDAIVELDSELVYLDDKTFGQSETYKQLPKIYKKIKAKNPNFQGFIIQTTAAEFNEKIFPSGYLERSGIKFVEIGVESYNNPVLRIFNKPANRNTIDRATDWARKNNIKLIPNIIVGGHWTQEMADKAIQKAQSMSAEDKEIANALEETKESYENTLEYLENNKDVISHINIYNFAPYADTILGQKIDNIQDEDKYENIIEKSFHKNPKLHVEYYKKFIDFAINQLSKEAEGGKEIRQERKAPERKASEGRPTPTGGAGGGSAGGGRPGLLVVQEELYPKPGDYVPVNKYPAEEFSEEQRFAVNMILSKRNKGGKGFVLGDGTGTGKTRTEIVAAVEVSRETNRPALIITQNKQIIKGNFIPQAKSIGIDLEKENIELGTYDDLRTGKIGGREYSIIIFDEAHNLKNTDSQKTMAAQNLKGDFKVYATATPMDRPTAAAYFVSETTGDPLEQVLDRIGVRIETIENRYGEQFKHAVLKEGFNWDKVFANLIQLRDQLAREGALVRREYPFYGDIEKQEIAIEDEDLLYEQELIDSYWQARIESARSTRAKRNFGGQRIMELSRWTEAQKIDQAVEAIEKEIAEGRQVIIVAEYVEESVLKSLPEVELPGTLKEIGKRLKSKGIAYAKIFGAGDKSKAVDEFQKGKVNVALTTPKSGGTGIDLDDVTGHAPRTMIILTPNFSGDVFEQTLGRVSRRNTASPAKVLFLTSQNAIADNRRYEILKHKLKILKTIQRGDDPDVAIGMFVEGENVVDAAVFDNSPGVNMATRKNLQKKVVEIDREHEEIENEYKKTFKKLQDSQEEYESAIETGEEEDVVNALENLREAEKEYQKYLERRQYLSEQRKNAISTLMDSGGIDPFGRPVADGVTMTYDGKEEYRKSVLEKAKDLMRSAEISRKARRLISGFLEDEEGKKYGVNTIVQHLREAIPVTIYVRKEQLKGHPGHFVRNGHFIRLLTTTDPDVNMHEIGHAIYQLYTETYGQIKQPHIQKMLLALTRELTTMASAYNLTEGYAELIRRFVVAPDSFDHIRVVDKDENGEPITVDIAPEDMQRLVEWMLSELKEKEPNILRALVDAQAMFYAHNSREESAIEQSYYSDQPKITEFDPDIQMPWLGAVGQVFNRGHGVNRYMRLIAKAMIRDGMPMKDVRAIFKHLRMQTQTNVTTALREAYHMTTRIIPESLAVVTGMGGKGVRVLRKDLTSFEYLSDMSLNDIIEIVGRENYDTFMKYVHNKAHLARINRAREKGISYEYPGKYSKLSEPVLKKLVREVEARKDGQKFIEASEKLEEFWNALLKVEERTGLITPEEYLYITTAHDYYADLHRVYAPGDEGKPAGAGRVIKYVSRLGSGSSAPPGDIIENAFNRSKRVLSSYYWNLLTNAMVEFSHQIGANKDIPYAARKLANRLVTPLNMDARVVARLSEEEQRKIIVKYLNEELLKVDPGAETLTTEDIEYMPGPLPVWRTKGPSAKYVVSYINYGTGQRHYIQINDKYIFQTFLHEETSEALDWVSDFVKEGIDPIKQLLVKNIAFALMNPMRDMFNAAFRGKGLGAVVPGKYMAVGLLNKIMKNFPDAEVVSEMLSVSLESMYSPNQRIRENAFMNILKRGVWQEGWSRMTKEEKLKHSFGMTTGAIMKPLDLLFHYIGFEYMAELFESATREGKAIEVIKQGGRMGDVFYHYDKISGSFGERSGYPVIEKVVRMAMFLNPAMQVTYDQFERLTDPIERRNATIQLFYIGMVMPAIIWALLALSRDDEEEKIYRLRPDSERMNYMYFPGGLRVPFNYGITGAMHSVIFAILDALVLGLKYEDRMKFAQAIKDRALDVPGADAMLPPPIGELKAIKSNYEPFYRSYIVPPYLATEPKKAQYYEDTPKLYKWLAWKVNGSPLMIEYFVKSALNRNYHYFITIPKRIENGQFTLDYFKDNPFELPFVGRMFTRTPTGHYAKPVQDVKQMADKFAAKAKVERTKLEMKTGKRYGNVSDISIVRMATEDLLKEKYGDSWQQSKEWMAFKKELNSLIRVENADRMIKKLGARLRVYEKMPDQNEEIRAKIESTKRRMVELALNAVTPTDEQRLDVKFLSE